MFRFFASRIIGTETINNTTPPNRVAAFFWHYLQPHKYWYFSVFVSILLVALLDLCIPIAIGYIAALLQAEDPGAMLFEQRWLYLGLGLIIVVIRPLMQMIDLGIRLNVVVPGTTALIRWQAHWHVVRQSWPFFQNDFAGRIANRVMQTGNAIRDSMLSTVRAIMYIGVYGISAIVVMILGDWRLAIPSLIWAVCYVVILRLYIPRLLKLSKIASEERSKVVGRVVDSYTNILTVKLFARAVDEDSYVREAMDSCQTAVANHTQALSWFLSSLHIINALLIAGTTCVGVSLWLSGAVSAALVATAVPLVWQITNISGWVSFEVAGIFENIGVVQDGMHSIAVAHDIVDNKHAKPLQISRGEITFSNVSFSYKDGSKVLENLNLTVRPGERVGIVGRSGAGKSTLINILLRFYDINTGTISVDGQDIRQVTQESLRMGIGLVTQDTSLLHRSIADNIRYGCTHATDAEVESAAVQAHAHEFIQGLVVRPGSFSYSVGLSALMARRDSQ